VDLLGFGIMIPMLPFYARAMGASAFEVGLLMFSYSALQVFSAPVWGRLSDQMGRKKILLFTIGGQAVAFFLAGVSSSFFLLLLSRSLAGLFAGNISTASAAMADLTSPEERAKGMGLIGAAFGLGFVFGPALGGILIDYGVEWPSFAAAFICFLNLIYVAIVFREPLRDERSRAHNRRRFSFQELIHILKEPRFFFPIFLFAILTFAFTQVEICFGLFVVDRFQMSERQAGLLLAAVGLMMALVQGGIIGPLVKTFGEKNLVIAGELILGVSVFAMGFSETPSFLIVCLSGMALGYSLVNPCLNAITSKAAGTQNQGAVLGIYQSAGGLARVVGPLVAGYAYDQGVSLPFIIAGASLWISALIAARFLKPDSSH
jgi:MFS family permease